MLEGEVVRGKEKMSYYHVLYLLGHFARMETYCQQAGSGRTPSYSMCHPPLKVVFLNN